MTIRKVTKHVFETSDGKPFDVKGKAQAHQARLDIAELLDSAEYDGDFSFGENAASAIIDSLGAFAEIIRPLIRKPRGKAAAEVQADEYEAALAEAKGKAA